METVIVKFWILLSAMVGYHVQDVWDFLLVWRGFRPEYPFTIFVMTSCPGWWFFTSRLMVGLTNAVVYAVVAFSIGFGVKKRRQLRNNLA
jgi:hypothetical protein